MPDAGTVTNVRDDVGDPTATVNDDAQNTDHLARLANREWLQRVRALADRWWQAYGVSRG